MDIDELTKNKIYFTTDAILFCDIDDCIESATYHVCFEWNSIPFPDDFIPSVNLCWKHYKELKEKNDSNFAQCK